MIFRNWIKKHDDDFNENSRIAKKRIVEVYQYVRKEAESGVFPKEYEKIYQYNAIFHQFGMDYEEFETGAGNFSIAIIELGSGEVRSVPIELIKFTGIEK